MGTSIVKFSKTLELNSDMGFESIRMKKDESFSIFYMINMGLLKHP